MQRGRYAFRDSMREICHKLRPATMLHLDIAGLWPHQDNPSRRTRACLTIRNHPAIGARCHDDGSPVTVVAPWDLSPIAHVTRADRAVVDQALDTAYGLYRNRDAWIPMRERVQILTRNGHHARTARGTGRRGRTRGGKRLDRSSRSTAPSTRYTSASTSYAAGLVRLCQCASAKAQRTASRSRARSRSVWLSPSAPSTIR